MKALISLFILSFIIITSSAPSFQTFAILSVPIMERVGDGKYKATKERIEDTFIRWLQASGADVIAVHTYTPKKEIEKILEKVNGVILPGISLMHPKTTSFPSSINVNKVSLIFSLSFS